MGGLLAMEANYHATLHQQTILVTGALGTVGRALLDILLQNGPAEIRVLDNNETGLFMLQEEMGGRGGLNVFLGDVRDRVKLEAVMEGVDIVFHTAAFKHVVLSEFNPFEAVQTNVLGVQNIIQQAIRAGVKRVVFTSSDKAANPTSVMGTSKLMGERLITAANLISRDRDRVFTSTRFGNVLGSSGSVVPVFARQIAAGGPVTLTDERMSRFVMTTRQSAELILTAASLAQGGEVFIPKMPAVRIADLARVMIEELAPAYGHEPARLEVRQIGAKPGEKLFEELMTAEEAGRSLESEDLFIVTPAFRGIYHQRSYSYAGAVAAQRQPYTSAEARCLSAGELREFLRRHHILESYLPAEAARP